MKNCVRLKTWICNLNILFDVRNEKFIDDLHKENDVIDYIAQGLKTLRKRQIEIGLLI